MLEGRSLLYLVSPMSQFRVWANSPGAASLASLMCNLEHFLHSQQLFSGLSSSFTLTYLHHVNLLPVWEDHWFHSCRHQWKNIIPQTIYCVTTAVKEPPEENVHLAEVKITVVAWGTIFSGAEGSASLVTSFTGFSHVSLATRYPQFSIYAQSCSSDGWWFFIKG